jgi:hypothetical protein
MMVNLAVVGVLVNIARSGRTTPTPPVGAGEPS